MDESSKMKAYAIFDGGGVKGAALAGCLQAAEDRKIEFVGYGGTSAGAIIALLACAGFKGRELEKIMVEEVNFSDFLDDSGAQLEQLKKIPNELRESRSKVKWLWIFWKYKDLLDQITQEFGLYRSRKLQDFLLRKLKEKLPSLEHYDDVTFDDLNTLHLPPLKIVASDIGRHISRVYSGSRGVNELNGSVLEAVGASMTYPFVFRPVQVNDRFLMDGGLCSNLPIFLFERERRSDGLPVIAFDLIASKVAKSDAYGFSRFCGDMLTTALESGEQLFHEVLERVYHVRIPVPEGIGTLDFALTRDQRFQLFTNGYYWTNTYLNKVVPQWEQALGTVEKVQALNVPPRWVVPVLRSIARDFEGMTPATSVRVSIKMPKDRSTLIVAYQFGMDNDSDRDLELAIGAGFSGRAWSTRLPVFGDLIEVKTNPSNWLITGEQQKKFRPDRKAVFSVPIFDVGRSAVAADSVNDLALLGVLSIDTDTPLADTKWLGDANKLVVRTAQQWADIISRILT
jgi:NTE family protein